MRAKKLNLLKLILKGLKGSKKIIVFTETKNIYLKLWSKSLGSKNANYIIIIRYHSQITLRKTFEHWYNKNGVWPKEKVLQNNKSEKIEAIVEWMNNKTMKLSITNIKQTADLFFETKNKICTKRCGGLTFSIPHTTFKRH